MFHSFSKLPITMSCEKSHIIQSNNKQRGSALVIAIFVIVVMSLLGAALVKIMDSSQENVAYEVLGTRAYNAAQTGIQWQLAQLFPLNNTIATCASITNSPPILNQISGFIGCEISSITCDDFLHPDSGVRYYTVKSIGQCAIDGEFVTREIEVEARSLQP